MLLCLLATETVAEETKAASEAETSTMDVGGRRIIVPNPPGGFVRVDGVNEAWDKTVGSMLPATNRLLGMYASREALEELRRGAAADTDRNFNIQIMKSLEAREIGERTFSDLRHEIRGSLDEMSAKLDAELKKLTDHGNRKLEKNLGVNAALSISNTAVLGVFEESTTALGFSMAMKVGVSTEKNREESRSVVACLMVPVNGRLVNLYATAPFHDKADQDQAETAVKAWRDSLVAANPRVEGPAGGFDWTKVGRSGVIGAIVGGLAAGLAALFRKGKTGAKS